MIGYGINFSKTLLNINEPAGVYFLMVEAGNEETLIRLIKEWNNLTTKPNQIIDGAVALTS